MVISELWWEHNEKHGSRGGSTATKQLDSPANLMWASSMVCRRSRYVETCMHDNTCQRQGSAEYSLSDGMTNQGRACCEAGVERQQRDADADPHGSARSLLREKLPSRIGITQQAKLHRLLEQNAPHNQRFSRQFLARHSGTVLTH
jgi:hypothetical protein